MKKLYSLFVFLALCLPLHAVDVKIPDQKILGAKNAIPLGELVELRLSDPPADTSPLLKTIYYKWNIFEVVDGKIVPKTTGVRGTDTKSIYFAAGIKARKLLVIVDCAYFFANPAKLDGKDVFVSTNLDFRQIKTEVSIGDVPPGPQPNPNPGPPDPIFPNSTYNIEKLTYKTAKATNLDKKTASVLIGSITKTMDSFTEETTLKAALTAIRANNDTALATLNIKADDINDFLGPINEKLLSLYKEDKALNSASDYSEFLKEMKTGLESYAK